MKQIVYLGIMATIVLSFVAIQQAQAYDIDSYVKQIEQEINKGLENFQNNTQLSHSDQLKIEIVKDIMDR